MEGYLYAIFMEPFFTYNLSLYDSYDLASWVLIGFAILVGLVIILNTTLTNLQELKHELSVLISLGFSHAEISRSRFGQVILQFLVAAPIGLVAGCFLAKEILRTIATYKEEFIYASGFKEYAITLLLVFAYLLVSHLIAMHSMKKWNISENVKDRE